jgi:hypothetical protein
MFEIRKYKFYWTVCNVLSPHRIIFKYQKKKIATWERNKVGWTTNWLHNKTNSRMVQFPAECLLFVSLQHCFQLRVPEALPDERRSRRNPSICLLHGVVRRHRSKVAFFATHIRLPLCSNDQGSWLQSQRSGFDSRVLTDFLRSSESGTGSTQPRWVHLRNHLKEEVAAPV